MFKINVHQNRPYDLHRPNGCTVLTIEVTSWPQNEFGLWLPEIIDCGGQIDWCNWRGDVIQEWQHADEVWTWSKKLEGYTFTSTLHADAKNSCLWCEHEFENRSREEIAGLSTYTCFHMVNAPEFISIHGERIWANLDDQWMSIDKVPRQESPDPRRVNFLKKGIRSERTVVRHTDFPSATMAEAACHPLIVVERINGKGSVGIASRDFRQLSNNNDSILRCLHSDPNPIATLAPGRTAKQESVILFSEGGHDEIEAQFERLVAERWKTE